MGIVVRRVAIKSGNIFHLFVLDFLGSEKKVSKSKGRHFSVIKTKSWSRKVHKGTKND